MDMDMDMDMSMNLDLNALEQKLNMVKEMSEEQRLARRPSSSSLPSTISDQMYPFLTSQERGPDRVLTAQEKEAREELIRQTREFAWGDDATRKAHNAKWRAHRAAELKIGMRGYKLVESYESEAAQRVTRRISEDDIRERLLKETATEKDQLACEFARVKEDYLDLAEKASIYLTTEEDFEGAEQLRIRIQGFKGILRVYDTLWQSSLKRIQEASEKRAGHRQGLIQNGVEDGTPSESGIEKARGPGRPKKAQETTPLTTVEKRGPGRPRKAQNDNVEESPSSPRTITMSPPKGTRAGRIRPPGPTTILSKTPAASKKPANPIKSGLRPKSGRSVASCPAAKPQGIKKSSPAAKP